MNYELWYLYGLLSVTSRRRDLKVWRWSQSVDNAVGKLFHDFARTRVA